LGKNGCCGGAVTGVIARLGSNFLDHLRTHVLELVFQFDLFCYRYTVFGDGRCTKAALEDHVTTFGAKRDLDCVGQNVNAVHHARTGVITE